MKAKTVRNKIIIVGGLSACLLLGGCGAGQAADATSAESTVAVQESTVTPTESTGNGGNCQHRDCAGRSTAS